MARKKLPRILLNPERASLAREILTDEEAGRLFFAIIDYAESGLLPSGESRAWNACFVRMKEDIDHDMQAYAEKCKNKARGANAMWEKRKASKSAPSDAFASCSDANAEKHMHEDAQHTTCNLQLVGDVGDARTREASSPAPPASEMMRRISDHQRAEQIIRRYGLPDNDPTLEAVLEDAEAHGWDKLEAALQKAALSNSRQKISVVFYRSILTAEPRKEKTGARADPYANYERF